MLELSGAQSKAKLSVRLQIVDHDCHLHWTIGLTACNGGSCITVPCAPVTCHHTIVGVSITVFEAGLLRNALRRESIASYGSDSSIDIGGLPALPSLGSSDSLLGATIGQSQDVQRATENLLRAVKAQDSIILNTQQQLQEAFLSHRHPGAVATPSSSKPPAETFQEAVDTVMRKVCRSQLRIEIAVVLWW